MTEPVSPRGIQIDVKSNGEIVLNFDHGDIPPIRLSQAGAEQVGSNIQSAAHRAKKRGTKA